MVVESRKALRLFGMDVDGVLTDGGIYYAGGGIELKRFHVQDGMGITLLIKAGIIPFIITARTSEATERRAKELGIEEVFQGVKDKARSLETLLSRYDATLEEVAFVGDDLSDLGVMLRVGLPIAVANAREEIKKVAKHVTKARGGEGAIREACEYVLKREGLWDKVISLYTGGRG